MIYSRYTPFWSETLNIVTNIILSQTYCCSLTHHPCFGHTSQVIIHRTYCHKQHTHDTVRNITPHPCLITRSQVIQTSYRHKHHTITNIILSVSHIIPVRSHQSSNKCSSLGPLSLSNHHMNTLKIQISCPFFRTPAQLICTPTQLICAPAQFRHLHS